MHLGIDRIRLKPSPYLREPNRLADVIAAIQAMGNYKSYKLSFERWAERITGAPSGAEHWQRVFEEHPEFFRLDGERKKASLVWRRQYPRRYRVDEGTEEAPTEGSQANADAPKAGSAEKQGRLSRAPLSPEDIRALIGTAIDLHARALEAQQDRRWWIPFVASAIGGVFGALLAAWLQLSEVASGSAG